MCNQFLQDLYQAYLEPDNHRPSNFAVPHINLNIISEYDQAYNEDNSLVGSFVPCAWAPALCFGHHSLARPLRALLTRQRRT